MPNPAEQAAESGKNIATKKAGPLPLWGWALVVVGVGGAVYYVFLRGSGSQAGSFLAGTPLSGGGGGSGPAASVPTEAAPLTNAQWLDNAVTAVEASIPGLTPGLARRYLIYYLGGAAPQGNAAASSLFDRVVTAAKQAVGNAPNVTQYNPNLNPYTNNVTWLSDALSFLGGTVPASVRNELTNLFYGTNTTISQAAATALENLRASLGNEPLPVSYTIGTGAAAPPASVSGFGETIFRLLGESGIDVRLRRLGEFDPTTGGFSADLADTTRWQAFQKVVVKLQEGAYKVFDESGNLIGSLNNVQAGKFLGPRPGSIVRTAQ